MKRTKKRMKIFTLLTCFFSAFIISAFAFPAHAMEYQETDNQSETEAVSSETLSAETVIRISAEEGTNVTIENEQGSPKPDRSSFVCTGNHEKDIFAVRIIEPGNYSYKLTVGANEYMVKVTGVYEETAEDEILTANTVILLPDGTKTDEPTWETPSDTPFGIADTPASRILTVYGSIALLTGLGFLLIFRKKEEKRR